MTKWQKILMSMFLAAGSSTGAQEFWPGPPPNGSAAPALEASWPIAEVPASFIQRFSESTWYTRFDYFHWNERLDGQDFVNEDGLLVTLGYVRRVGQQRFRAELFHGNVGYRGGVQYDDGTSEPLSSHTNYLGVRGEYDLLHDPEWWPTVSFLVGIGTRYWVRDLPDDVTASGVLVTGYQEAWWTIYPYVGIETRRLANDDDLEFYGSARIGATAITLQRVSLDDVALYPHPGLTGQLEVGVRGPRLFLASFVEAMTWAESDVVRNSLQPSSHLLTAGLRTGFCF